MSARVLTLALLAVLLGTTAPAALAAGPASPVTAQSWVLVDAETGRTLAKHNPDERRAVASTTKLMTVLLALENAKLSDVVDVPRYHAAPAESVIGLRAGEQLTVADLIRAALVFSANDAAEALAEHVGGTRDSFVRMMNRRAIQLGLSNTRYANPIGLDDPNNYSTADDLVKLTLVLRENAFFRKVVRAESVTLKSGSHPRVLDNRNDLVGDPSWIDGVKTGHTTQAGGVLVASGRQHGRSLIAAVVGSASVNTRDDDALTLLRYGYSMYVLRRALERGWGGGRVPIRFRPGAEVVVSAARTVRRTFPKHTHLERVVRGLPAEVDGPLAAGAKLGSVDVYAHEPGVKQRRLVATVALLTEADIPAASSARRTQDALTRPWTMYVLLGAIAVAAFVARVTRPPGRTRRRPPRGAEGSA